MIIYPQIYSINPQRYIEYLNLNNHIQNMNNLQKLSIVVDLLSAVYPRTAKTLKLIGLIIVVKKIISILVIIYKKILRRRRNFIKRYGRSSWALVTGSSDGIGKAIAFSLAKRGFNIVLSARTQSKLDAARIQIRQKYKNIEVKTLVLDYGRSAQPSYLAERMKQLEDIDISILVNNVGVDVLDYYHNLSEEAISNLINVNCFAVSIMNRILIPHFIDRFQRKNIRSAIVNVSSVAGQIPMALHNVYSASKAFIDILSRSLSYQYDRSIDIISLRPSQVSTPMTFNKDVDMLTILPHDCAEGLLNDLGYQRITNGHWSHGLQSWFYNLVPQCVFNHIFLKHLGPQFIEQRKRARRSQH